MKRVFALIALLPSFSYTMDFASIIAEEAGKDTFKTAFGAFAQASSDTATNTPGFMDPLLGGAAKATPWGMIFQVGGFGLTAYSLYRKQQELEKTKKETEAEKDQIREKAEAEKKYILQMAESEKKRMYDELDLQKKEYKSFIEELELKKKDLESNFSKILSVVEKATTATEKEKYFDAQENQEEDPEVVESLPTLRDNGIIFRKTQIKFQ